MPAARIVGDMAARPAEDASSYARCASFSPAAPRLRRASPAATQYLLRIRSRQAGQRAEKHAALPEAVRALRQGAGPGPLPGVELERLFLHFSVARVPPDAGTRARLLHPRVP